MNEWRIDNNMGHSILIKKYIDIVYQF